MRAKILFSGSLFLLICLPFQSAYATESLFGHSFTTDTLPKNKWEVAQSYFGKFGKESGTYASSLYRTQVEYGVTSFLQSSLYINTQHIYANKNTASGSKFKFHSVSIENILRLLSPYMDPVGAAVFFEPTLGPDQYALDQRFIFQKNFKEDRLVIPLNIKLKLNWNKKDSRWDKKMEFEYTTGFLYRFIRNLSGGAEWRGAFNSPNFNPADLHHAAYFLGPTLHYGARRFWATISVLFQLPVGGGRILGNEYEKIEVRAKTGYVF